MTWLVDPQTPFLCDSCDHYHPIGEHQACRDAAHGPEFEASGTGTAKARTSGPGVFRHFWANVARKPCPECKHPTAVGFDRNDPGAESRKPAKCVLCVKAEVENAIQFARGEIGYPLTEQGPCANAACRITCTGRTVIRPAPNARKPPRRRRRHRNPAHHAGS